MTDNIRPASARVMARASLGAALGVTLANGAFAEDAPHLSFYGTPGLIEMPAARSMPDGQLAFTIGQFGDQRRGTLTFQILPRLSGSFRYARILDYSGSNDLYDRSFDLRFQALEEHGIWPGVVVGLQDLAGTGAYSGEYVAATRSFGPDLEATLGLGWGRFGTDNGFTNPLGAIDKRFEMRPGNGDRGNPGGQPEADRWFRGEAAFFGGVEWGMTDRTTLLAEYSSDAYEGKGGFERKSPFNVGFSFEAWPGVDVGGYYLYGTDIGVTLSFTIDPAEGAAGSGIEEMGPRVAPRPDPQAQPMAWTTSWTEARGTQARIGEELHRLLEGQDLALESYRINAGLIEVRYRNTTYGQAAQAVGRIARGLTQILPPSVETFVLVPVQAGMPTTAITLKRSDIEAYENEPEGASLIQRRAKVGDAAARPAAGLRYPEQAAPFDWRLGPYLATGLFDPDAPLRYDLGVELSAEYEPAPGLVFAGAVRQLVYGTRGDSSRFGNSELPPVRTDGVLYSRTDEPFIQYLTGAYYFRPGVNLYGRITGGLLERMYGGVSSEILWQRPEDPLALGIELNYARQRDYGMRFDFRDYDVTTGHASAYYQFNNGFLGQLDAGRYLAGDWGATAALSREFDNGWRVGGYFTLTDVPAEEFGEGSFDKGIWVTIPISALSGRPSQDSRTVTLQPIQRDGGARLKVRDRLYETIRDSASSDLRHGWGRFWR